MHSHTYIHRMTERDRDRDRERQKETENEFHTCLGKEVQTYRDKGMSLHILYIFSHRSTSIYMRVCARAAPPPNTHI